MFQPWSAVSRIASGGWRLAAGLGLGLVLASCAVDLTGPYDASLARDFEEFQAEYVQLSNDLAEPGSRAAHDRLFDDFHSKWDARLDLAFERALTIDPGRVCPVSSPVARIVLDAMSSILTETVRPEEMPPASCSGMLAAGLRYQLQDLQFVYAELGAIPPPADQAIRVSVRSAIAHEHDKGGLVLNF